MLSSRGRRAVRDERSANEQIDRIVTAGTRKAPAGPSPIHKTPPADEARHGISGILRTRPAALPAPPPAPVFAARGLLRAVLLARRPRPLPRRPPSRVRRDPPWRLCLR